MSTPGSRSPLLARREGKTYTGQLPSTKNSQRKMDGERKSMRALLTCDKRGRESLRHAGWCNTGRGASRDEFLVWSGVLDRWVSALCYNYLPHWSNILPYFKAKGFLSFFFLLTHTCSFRGVFSNVSEFCLDYFWQGLEEVIRDFKVVFMCFIIV